MSSTHTNQLTKQGQRRRESLLDAAEGSLVSLGSAEASLRTIATEAGVRVGHLQHYFPTRGNLVRALLTRVLDRSLQRLAAVAAVLRRFYRDYAGHVAEFVRLGRPQLSRADVEARGGCFVALVEGVSLLRSGIAGDRSEGTDTVLRTTAVELLTR